MILKDIESRVGNPQGTDVPAPLLGARIYRGSAIEDGHPE
jgi:hypothetical protein